MRRVMTRSAIVGAVAQSVRYWAKDLAWGSEEDGLPTGYALGVEEIALVYNFAYAASVPLSG